MVCQRVTQKRAAFAYVVDSTDHVYWYDPSTLVELGRRNDLSLLKFIGIAFNTQTKIGAKLFFKLSPLMVLVIRLSFSQNRSYMSSDAYDLDDIPRFVNAL